MTTFIVIIFGLLISFIIVYIILNLERFKPKKKSEYQKPIDETHSEIPQTNNISVEQSSPENKSSEHKKDKDYYKDHEFVNKNCTKLEDFIINDEINSYDLRKLADLNGIRLEISEGWYPLVIDLIKELNAHGWDKKVSCIKQKYAELRFYTNHKYGDEISNIIEKYEEKSKYICETCGERGETRYNSSWQYVACKKHYLEKRGKITLEENGFQHNDTSYLWKDVKNAVLKDPDYYQNYKFLIFELKENIINHAGWDSSKLYISKNVIGFGNLLGNLPETFRNLNRSYLQYYKNPEFCAYCGYKAVYNNTCECCEYSTWECYVKEFKKENTEERKLDFIKYRQISWTIDEGEIYEKTQSNYLKNPDYRILFTEEELKEYEEALNPNYIAK